VVWFKVQATRISIFYTVLKLKPDYDAILKSLNTPGIHSWKEYHGSDWEHETVISVDENFRFPAF